MSKHAKIAAELREAYLAAQDAEYLAKVKATEYNLLVLKMSHELRVPSGHSIDIWGDGKVKPDQSCAPVPIED